MAPAQIITVSGLPGSGTSTACGQLCTRVGWVYVDAGQIFRQLAKESGLSLAKFGHSAEADGGIDRQLDERMVARARGARPPSSSPSLSRCQGPGRARSRSWCCRASTSGRRSSTPHRSCRRSSTAGTPPA